MRERGRDNGRDSGRDSGREGGEKGSSFFERAESAGSQPALQPMIAEIAPPLRMSSSALRDDILFVGGVNGLIVMTPRGSEFDLSF